MSPHAPVPPEWILAVPATAVLAVAAVVASARVVLPAGGGPGAGPDARRTERALLALLAGATLLVATAVVVRWVRLGHGPFLTMFEILASNVASLGIAYTLAFWRVPPVRRAAPVAVAVLLLLASWMVVTDASDSVLPPTYEMPILWIHVLLGKGFLGCVLVALGLAALILAAGARRGTTGGRRVPAPATLDRLAWRFMGGALAFESMMLVAGAVWAQDAWGRYWAWDSLETYAFLTWLLLASAIHARTAFRLSPGKGAVLIVAVFALAFFTFFGVPFVSVAPHQGAV